MGILSEGIVIVKKYHRHILLGFLGLLFVLDIVTTTVALQRGNSEQNQFMIPFVQDPVLHLAIKVIAYIFLFITVERAYHVLIRIESRKKEVFVGENVPPDHLCTGDPGTGVSHLILCVCRCTEYDDHFFVGRCNGNCSLIQLFMKIVHEQFFDHDTPGHKTRPPPFQTISKTIPGIFRSGRTNIRRGNWTI